MKNELNYQNINNRMTHSLKYLQAEIGSIEIH